MKENCLIFDMDGTLVNSQKNITSSVNHTRKFLGLEPIGQEMIYEHINTPHTNLALKFYNQEEFSDETKEVFYKHYIDECVKELHFYDGIKELLEKMSKKAKLAIATNAYDVFAKKMMKHLGVVEYFDAIIGANTAQASKPDGQMAKYVIDKLHVKKQNTVLIGDSQKDELCALDAGVNFIFCEWGYGEYKSAQKYLCKTSTKLEEKICSIFPNLRD